MDIIELERWKPSEANPHKLEYAGQPVAQEVFEELKHRLYGRIGTSSPHRAESGRLVWLYGHGTF